MYRPLSPLSGLANERLAGDKARRADHRAVGIKASERPVNSLSPVNNSGASAIKTYSISSSRIFLRKRRRFPAASFQNNGRNIEQRYFGKAVSTVACCGINMHPCRFQPASRAPTQDRETGATASLSSPCRRSIFVNFLQLRPWEITLPPERDLRCLYSRRSLWKTPFNMMKPG